MASVARFASSLEKMTSDQAWKPYGLAVAAVFAAKQTTLERMDVLQGHR